MDKFKALFTNKKFFYAFIGVLVGILLILGIIFGIFYFIGKKMSYSELENELYFASIKYVEAQEKEVYPDQELVTTFTDRDLTNGGYIKDISKLAKDNCSSEITVTYRYGNYQVRPYLTCDKYESSLFFERVLDDNHVVTEGNGLYDVNNDLVFRGDRVNNYVRFNNQLYRIVKMDPDTHYVTLILNDVRSSLYTIWDDRYNSSEESSHGINDFGNSTISYTLSDIQTETFGDLSRMIQGNACIGKRTSSDEDVTGYIECSVLDQKASYVSLLPLYDYMNASMDYRCTNADEVACSNQNYLATKEGKWWTLTADGSKGSKVFGINYNGRIISDYANSKKYVRYVIVVDGTNLYQEGNGTQSNPYMMK